MKPPVLYGRRMGPDGDHVHRWGGEDPNIGTWGVFWDGPDRWFAWADIGPARFDTPPCASRTAALRSLRGQIESLRRAIERLQGKGTKR